MSKHTTNKRKASEEVGTNGSFDESADAFRYSVAALQDPSSFASTILGWLPQDASLETADAKKLLKTFDLVKAELQHRTNLMAESSVETGANSYVVLPQQVWNRKLQQIDVPTFFNTYLLETRKLSEYQHTNFWQVVSAVQRTFGDNLSEDAFIGHVALAWNTRHAKMMQSCDVGLGGNIREAFVRTLLKHSGRKFRSERFDQGSEAANKRPRRMAKQLRKEDIGLLSYRDMAPWLRVIDAPLTNTKPKRQQQLEAYFARQPDGHRLIM